MQVQTIAAKFRCPVCLYEYLRKGEAASCLDAHKEGYARKAPKYRVGAHVVTRHFNDGDYAEEEARIIRIKGRFLSLRLLVESENGERYWVPAVSYQSADFSVHNPASFRFVPLPHRLS